MKDYIDLRLREFLDDLGAKQPTPGGGSCAAVTGAIGVGLGEMALRYTLASDKYKEHHEALQKILDQLGRLQQMFRELIKEDMAAYEAYAAAAKGKEGSEDQQNEFQQAVMAATTVPLETVGTAAAALRAMAEAKDKCSPWLVSDLLGATWLTEAAAMAAAENVSVNLHQLGQTPDAQPIKAMLHEQIGHVLSLRAEITG